MTRTVHTKLANPRRQQILDAALALIARVGVNAVTMRAVAEEAEVPLASTAYYFDSKSALLEEALEQMIARSTEFIRRYTSTDGQISRSELIDKLVDFATAQVDDPDALLRAQYELILEASRAEYLRPLAQRWGVMYMNEFTKLIRAADVPRPELASDIIMTFIEGALVDYMTTLRSDFADGYLRPLLTELVTAWCAAGVSDTAGVASHEGAGGVELPR